MKGSIKKQSLPFLAGINATCRLYESLRPGLNVAFYMRRIELPS